MKKKLQNASTYKEREEREGTWKYCVVRLQFAHLQGTYKERIQTVGICAKKRKREISCMRIKVRMNRSQTLRENRRVKR